MTLALDLSYEQREILACAEDFPYWCRRYVQIYDAPASDWIPFALWPEQEQVAALIAAHQQTAALKARQLGLTWLLLALILHGMLFYAIFEALIFSKREDEAFYLLGEERLKGMYYRLPIWMQAREVVIDSASHFRLSNGSGVRAFPSNAGDSYTANFALIDEADLVPDLSRLLRSVKPTIEAGGKIVLLSRSDKSRPQSLFKQIYRAAKQGLNEWWVIFLAWYVHPDRDAVWYEKQRRDILANTGSLDDLHEQYPETDVEALAPRTLDKRIPAAWLNACYDERGPLDRPAGAPAIAGLLVYELPQPGVAYTIGADPAEGNPTSDDSAFAVVRTDTNAEVAALSGKFEPAVLAAHIHAVGQWYNKAAVMVERNNHGHAVLLWLRDNSPLARLRGLDKKEGWLSNTLGKAQVYDHAADCFRDEAATVRSFKSYTQLASIEGSTLRAPEGEMDDCADAFVFALAHSLAPRPSTNVHVLKRGS